LILRQWRTLFHSRFGIVFKFLIRLPPFVCPTFFPFVPCRNDLCFVSAFRFSLPCLLVTILFILLILSRLPSRFGFPETKFRHFPSFLVSGRPHTRRQPAIIPPYDQRAPCPAARACAHRSAGISPPVPNSICFLPHPCPSVFIRGYTKSLRPGAIPAPQANKINHQERRDHSEGKNTCAAGPFALFAFFAVNSLLRFSAFGFHS